jgi:hypothetical protein
MVREWQKCEGHFHNGKRAKPDFENGQIANISYILVMTILLKL